MKTGRTLAAALGITPEWLMFGTEPAPSAGSIKASVDAWRKAAS